MSGEVVQTLGIFIDVKIRQFSTEVPIYDWVTSGGLQSDRFFETLEAAKEDAESNFQ